MHCHLHRGNWSFHLTNTKKKKKTVEIGVLGLPLKWHCLYKEIWSQLSRDTLCKNVSYTGPFFSFPPFFWGGGGGEGGFRSRLFVFCCLFLPLLLFLLLTYNSVSFFHLQIWLRSGHRTLWPLSARKKPQTNRKMTKFLNKNNWTHETEPAEIQWKLIWVLGCTAASQHLDQYCWK